MTSPPYWGLRDYGEPGQLGLEPVHDCLAWARSEPPCGSCFVCSMRRVAGGKARPDEGLWRVLRRDGTFWLNLGDTFATGAGKVGLKAKDLAMIPARVALALQADGWWVRQDHIWEKPNCTPSSIRDRATTSHEHVIHLAKSERYFLDWFSVQEEAVGNASGNTQRREGHQPKARGIQAKQSVPWEGGSKRHWRSVMSIRTSRFDGAHFATFPAELPERFIKAGTSERGACASCGAPWKRVVEKAGQVKVQDGSAHTSSKMQAIKPNLGQTSVFRTGTKEEYVTVGWAPSCACGTEEVVPCVVLDPFAGSGTTLSVALQHGRHAVGIELNPEYAKLARERIRAEAPLATSRRLDAWGSVDA